MNSSPLFSPPRARAIAAPAASPLWKRRQRALAVGFVLVWPAFYSACAHGAPLSSSALEPAPMRLRVGKSVTFPLAPNETVSVERGAALAQCETSNGALSVRALSPGLVVLRLQHADGKVARVALRFVDASTRSVAASTGLLKTNAAVAPALAASTGDPLSQIPPIPANLLAASSTGAPSSALFVSPQVAGPASGSSRLATSPDSPLVAPASGSASPNANRGTAGFPNGGAVVNPPAGFPGGLPSPATTSGGSDGTDAASPDVSGVNSLPLAVPTLPTPARTNRPSAVAPSAVLPAASGPQVLRPLAPAPPRQRVPRARAPRISPVLPAPTTNRKADVIYRTTPRLPRSVSPSGPRPGIEVTQGLARLVSFPDNILSVFFSDPGVMDARAINARTIAVTGTGAGTSTLAVFTSRFPGDAVGHAIIYRVQTLARGGSSNAQALSRDPQALETAISAALGDPRVRATVVSLPDGSFAARLQGVVRNEAEVTGAVSTASFYVPRVVSSLYADVNAPSIDAVRSGVANLSPTDTLQDNLRRLTGNSSIELISLPTGLALKAQTNSSEEAEAILRVLPSLNQPIVPFIVVRGLANSQSPYYNSDVPLLQGEDRQLTDKLQAVTGIRTVYAVRASGNSVAIYGNVLTRGDYETVKRYGLIIAQQSVPVALQGTSQGGSNIRPTGIEPALPDYDPAAGYLRPLNVQMFVRILDPAQAVVRNVTVETNVVEISRTALDDLGVQFGSAPISSETVTPGSAGTVTVLHDAAGNPVVDARGNVVTQTTGATPSIVNRTINPTLNQGIITAANGFAGGGAFQFLDPFRAQLTALSNRGDARILARPNVRAMEGMPAQITIGGERPVPSAVATTGATAQSVEFRRFGVIISMRPTVSDDNTIILQIRADITQPDTTYGINLNGAIIPGESVRSVDTTIAVRPGDVIVMGGLMTNEKRQQTSKIPILGDLPIIGALFKSKRFENNETELAIFMTPRIDSLPASPTTEIIKERSPAFPLLPSRQESNAIQFQSTRAPG